MTHASTADPTATPQWPAPPGPLVGGPRDRPQGGALPTDVDRFRELVWQTLAAADPSGRRWLAALGAFELLRHGAAEPDGVLHASGRTIASMLRVAETTWCRSTCDGQAGYGRLLEAAGLLVREDWERYRLPAWEALQNRAPDATLRGRFVYTHRPAFRATVVRWRLGGVSLAALGAWSLLRYCHTRWDTAELALCDAAIARAALGVKPHTWAAYAQELASCGALQRLRPTAGSGYRLPLYFVLRTGRGLDQALARPATGDARNGQVRAGAAVQLHATSAAPHAEPAAGLSHSRAREDPVGDGGVQEHPDDDVERTLERLAAVAGDAWQQQQVRASTTLRARCAELLERTGWSPRRLADELCRRELRTACEPVRVLAHRARVLLEAAPQGERPTPAPTPEAATPGPHEHDDHPGQAADPARDDQVLQASEVGQRPKVVTDLDALDEQARGRLLDAARARLRRIGLPRTGDFPDDHPLLRGEALNLLQAEAPPPMDTADQPATARDGQEPAEASVGEPLVAPAPTDAAPGDGKPARRPARRRRSASFRGDRCRRSRPTAPAPTDKPRHVPPIAPRPRGRDPPGPSSRDGPSA